MNLKILILHNQLWSQYKSFIYQGIYDKIKDTNDELLVLQTSICENSRFDIKEFNQEKYPYTYPYKLLNFDYLENTNKIITTIKWLRCILKFRPNVINLTGYQEIGILPVLLLSKLLDIRTIMTNESIYSKVLHNSSLKYYIKHIYKRFLFLLTDGFFSYGIKSNDYLFRHGVNKKKILLFLNSFDKTKFSNENSFEVQGFNKNIIFVGRLSPEKNLKSLISLFRLFKADQLDYKLILVGEGPLKEKLHNDILKYGLNIDIIGSILWNDLSELYKNSKCLILPSINETWGMVANEAIQMGISVICSASCGCANDLVIDHYSGLVVNNFDFSDKKDTAYLEILDFLRNNDISKKKFLKNNALVFDSERLINESLFHLTGN
jgi:glycosyltransferase involved in cell wall biosynthesis